MANIQLANYDPRDVNYLRQLYAAGQITDEDLNSGMMSVREPQNALAQMLQPPQQQQMPDNLARAVPGAGFQDLQSGQGVVQQEGGPVIRINSQPSQGQDLSGMADVTRPIEIAGHGKGYYSKDGRTAIINGRQIMLGYDREKTQANQDRALKVAKANSDLEHQAAQTAYEKEKLRQAQLPPAPEKPHFDAASGMMIYNDANGPRAVGIPGYQKEDKPLTESQGKATGLGQRAMAAHNILLSMEAPGVGADGKMAEATLTPSIIKMGAEGVPLIGEGLGMLANKWVASPEQQKVDQAQRDFVNAALRVESGASISPSEFNNARKQYFPQPGDDAATILQKQQAREREIKALADQSGTGIKKITEARGKAPDALTRSRAVFEAQKAIAAGADPVKVRQRLSDLGIQ